jgi:hypothetical protein
MDMELQVGERFYLDGYSGYNMRIEAYRDGVSLYVFYSDRLFASNNAVPGTLYFGLNQDGSHGNVYHDSRFKLFKLVIEGPYIAYIEPLVYDGFGANTNTVVRKVEGSKIPPMVVGWKDNAYNGTEGTTLSIEAVRQRYHSYPEETYDVEIVGTSTADSNDYNMPSTISFARNEESVMFDIEILNDTENSSEHLDIKLIAPVDKELEWNNQQTRITIIDDSPVVGCMDPDALNYDPNATVSGSCDYPVVEGCTDPASTNFNPEANLDDGSCEYPDPNASDCLISDDLYEQRFWFKVFFVNPPNGEQLHEQALISYDWKFLEQPDFGNVTFEGYADNKRVGKVKYDWIADATNSQNRVQFEVEATAKDLRFSQLDIADSDTEIVSFLAPCVNDGNTPTFIVDDVTITEPESGTAQAVFTITASEPIVGKPITVDFCTSDVTASSQNESIEVNHAAYDVQGNPFISYLDYQNIRACFDASFPKYYNSYIGTTRGDQAKQLYENALNWLDHSNLPNRVLVLGDSTTYNVKGMNTSTADFGLTLQPWAEEFGYTADLFYFDEFQGGTPTPADFMQYSVIVFMSSYFSDTPTITESWVTQIESAIRQGVGLLVITDHTQGNSSFAINGNRIVRRFFAEFSGSIDRTSGTDFDAVRAQYGDHPLIAGMTGTMSGDSSEGLVETNNAVFDPDYVTNCSSVTFNEGEQSKSVPVVINTDNLYEDTETFNLTISNPSRGFLGRNVGTGTIQEWIVPEVKVELDSQGAKKQVFVGRDTSGSTDAEEVTVNNASATRRELMEQILMDFEIANCTIPATTGHGTDGCTSNGGRVQYSGVVGASATQTVTYLQGVVSDIDSDTDEISILVMNDSSDVVSNIDPATVWDNELVTMPRNIPFTLTFVRVCSEENANQTSGAFYDAKVWFEAVIANAPANVVGYFKTFFDYSTGGDSELNDILNSTLKNDYRAWCTTRPDSVLIINATDEDTARTEAESQITCP